MKKIIIILTLMIFGFFTTSCSDKDDAKSSKSASNNELPLFSTKYNPNANPEEDLKFAISMAQEQNKRILLDVGGDWCPWCRAFDKFIEDKPRVKSFLHDNFVLVKVFYGKENYNMKFLSGFPRVIATPHFFILKSDGAFISSGKSEPLEKGRSYDELKVLAMLKKWVTKK